MQIASYLQNFVFGREIEIVSYIGFNPFLVLTKLSLSVITNNVDEDVTE